MFHGGDHEPLLVVGDVTQPPHLLPPGVYQPKGRFFGTQNVPPVLLLPILLLSAETEVFFYNLVS